MRCSRWSARLSLSLLVSLPGCGALEQPDRDVLVPLAVRGTQFYYEHYALWDEWEGHPSSLWRLDLQTGESRRLSEPESRSDLVIGDEYYVFTAPGLGDGESGNGSLVCVEMSTGDRFTILENLEDVYLPYFVEGERLAYMTYVPELVIYDLAGRSVSKVLEAPQDAAGVWGFCDGRVLTCLLDLPEDTLVTTDAAVEGSDEEPVEWKFAWLLVDTETGEWVEFAFDDESWLPMPGVGALSSDWIAAGGMVVPAYEGDDLPMEVRGLYLPTGTWRTFASYEPAATVAWLDSFEFAFAMVSGLTNTHVAVYSVRGLEWATELIELQSGERTELSSGGSDTLRSSDSAITLLDENQAYWIEPGGDSLVTYEISSGARRVLQLGF